MDNKGRFKKAEREQLIERFLAGKISKINLPFDVIEQIYEQMLRYGKAGFGETFTDPYNPFYSTTKKFNENLARFSAYKITHNLNDLENARKTLTGEQFARQAPKIQEKYLFNWLETEYKTNEKLSQGARKWAEIEADKNVFPFLEYVAILDDNTRDEHAALDGIVKPVNHSFWDKYMPPNGYNCRCSVDKRRNATETDLRKKPLQEVDNNMNEIFKHNPGKSGKIFKGSHPYFDQRKRNLTSEQKKQAEEMANKLLS
jgi:SPP1 gp7 family putative phage head morphogenesis protein